MISGAQSPSRPEGPGGHCDAQERRAACAQSTSARQTGRAGAMSVKTLNAKAEVLGRTAALAMSCGAGMWGPGDAGAT